MKGKQKIIKRSVDAKGMRVGRYEGRVEWKRRGSGGELDNI